MTTEDSIPETSPTPPGEAPARTAVLVLGMHRSGTSALAGTLSILGCVRPASEMAPTAGNEKGYFESTRIVRLHNELLESAGSRWDDWLPVNPGWSRSPRAEEFLRRMAETVEAEFGDAGLFVLKDPRTCRLVGFWREVLARMDCAPLVVHTNRNPLEVAASLEKREGTPREYGVLLWLRHVLDAEHDSRGLPRFFTSYTRLMTDWHGLVEEMQQRLGLHLPRQSPSAFHEVEEFLSSKLWHAHKPSEAVENSPTVSPWVRDAYEILERWAAQGEDEADWATLDRIRSEFTASASEFDRLASRGRESQAEARRLREEVARLQSDASAVAEALASAGVAGRTLQDKMSALARGAAEAAHLRSESSRQRSELERRDKDLAQRSARIGELEASLKDRFRELATLSQMLADTQRELNVQQDALSGVLNSTSWRVTEPLRKALDLVKRGRSRPAGMGIARGAE